jgi:acetyl esterase/lipase
MRKHFVLLVLLAGVSINQFAQTSGWQPPSSHTTLPIWPNGSPGAPPNSAPEVSITTAKDNFIAGKPIILVTNVSTPTITLYEPAGKNTEAAVVVFPGGGYHGLAIDLEGTEVCDELNSSGIACVLLKYRVPDSGPYPKFSSALQDAQRAVGIVRSHAAEWHIDPKRIGVLGFSAGGHLAAVLSSHYEQRVYSPIDAADQVSCRPDFTILIYPAFLTLSNGAVALSPDIRVTSNTPPAFLVQAENDPVHVENLVTYFLALKNVKVPAEMHIYALGGHGYGLRRTALPITAWPPLLEIWLHAMDILPPSGTKP